MKKDSLPYLVTFSPAWIIFGTLAFIIIPFVIWASYARLDQVSHAVGQVIAVAKTQEIQSAVEGVVEEIYVHEGDEVKSGDVLIGLEKSQYQAGYDESSGKVAALEAALTRLQAEVYNRPLVFTSLVQKYPEFVQNQTELYHRRKNALSDEIGALKESLRLAQDEYSVNEPLIKNGDIGATEIIRIRRQMADLNGQILNKKNKYFQDSQADMTKVEEELSSKSQEFTERGVTLGKTAIVSHMDAKVKNIIVTTKGARVRAGDVILELVPTGGELVVEAKLSPSDVAFVKKGQRAGVKLDTYDYTIYGIFNGVVKYISPDTLMEKTSRGETPYFKVLITLAELDLVSKGGRKVTITPGMSAQVDIVTGNKTVMEYLTKPITKTLSESFGER